MNKDISDLISNLQTLFHDAKNALSCFREAIDDDIYTITLKEVQTHEYQAKILTSYSKFGVKYSQLVEMILDVRTVKKTIEQTVIQQSFRQTYLSQIVGLENSINILRDAYDKLKPAYDSRIKYMQYSQFLVSTAKSVDRY